MGRHTVAAISASSVLFFALHHASAVAACDSRSAPGVAILSIKGGNGPTLDLLSATDCATQCCEHKGCNGWSFTPTTRADACPNHGCCFLKMAAETEINSHTHNMYNSTAGCIGFACRKPTNPPSPQPGGHHVPPAPPAPARSLPFPYVTPFFQPFEHIFANHSTDALRDPTTAIFSAERGGSWHVYCSSMVCRGPGGGNCGGGYPARIRHWSRPGTLTAGPAEERSAAWTDEGLVLEPQYDSSKWDASGTFTPGIVKDCRGQACKFYLFFVSQPCVAS